MSVTYLISKQFKIQIQLKYEKADYRNSKRSIAHRIHFIM